VDEVELLPNLGRSNTYQHNILINPNDNSGIDQMPLLPNQIRFPDQRIPSHNMHTFERVQFESATANNGQRRAAQQFFHLVITLHADIAPLNSNGPNGTHEPRWMPVRHLFSHGVVVRGRSPTHYKGTDSLAKVVINEEDEDPTVNDYNTPDDSSVAVVAVAPGVPLGSLARPFYPQIAPISTDPVGGWEGLLGDDEHLGYGRPMASAGSAVSHLGRTGVGRLAGSGSAGRGSGASAPRSTGGRRPTRAAQSALAPQRSGRVEKKTPRQKGGKKASSASTASQQQDPLVHESAVAAPRRRGNNRQDFPAAASTTASTTTTTTAQLTSYPGQFLQPMHNMIRDTDPAPLYTFTDFVADNGYDMEHSALHEHAPVHDHVHHDYELGHEPNEEPDEDQDQEHELGSSASSSVKHEQSSSLSPQLRRRTHRYHPASFSTPPSETIQSYQQHDYDPTNMTAPLPPWRGLDNGTVPMMQVSETVLPELLTYDFCFVDDVPSAVASAERSTDR